VVKKEGYSKATSSSFTSQSNYSYNSIKKNYDKPESIYISKAFDQ
jgi:hypothetical protein